MNKLLATIVAILVMASFTTAVSAADASKLNERNMKAKALSGSPKSADTPAVPSAQAVKPVVPETPVVTVKPAAVPDSAAKQRNGAKLRERNKKARALSGSTKNPESSATPATPAVK